jgi:hypothetical protein
MTDQIEKGAFFAGRWMSFLLDVYYASDAENEAGLQRDRDLYAAGMVTEREFFRRCATRNFARRLRRGDGATTSAGPSARPSDAALH